MKRIYHTASTTAKNIYQYSGKEILDFNGYNMNDYGARYYDTALGRWNVLDPLVEKYHAFSPYNFVVNTPLKHVDLDGRGINGGFSVTNNSNQTITIRGGGRRTVDGPSWYHIETTKDSRAKEYELKLERNLRQPIRLIKMQMGIQ